MTTATQAKVAQLVAEPERWSRGRSKVSGREFWVIPGSAGHAHWTALDGSGCTCPSYRFRGRCSHAAAAKIRHDREQVRRLAAELGA